MSIANIKAGSLTSNLEYALYYSGLGWKVFPAHTIRDGHCSCGKSCKSPGKHPMTRNGLKDATTDRQAILKWWNKTQDANIAIRTGKESGLLALDIDTKSNGFDSLYTLENTFEVLPETLTSITGSNGKHIFFKHPGTKVKTRSNIVEGIDFRGDGGYIIAPPSIHSSGRAYQWIDIDKQIYEAPEWLLELVNNQGNSSNSTAESIPEGARNSSLMSLAGSKWSQGVTKKKLQTYLLEENQMRCEPPLCHAEVIGIVESVSRYKPGVHKFIFTWREQFMNSYLPSNSKLVLHTLACHMNSSGRSCYPTHEQISKESSISRKTISKHISLCCEKGWLEKYKHTSNEQKYWNYGYIAKLPDV